MATSGLRERKKSAQRAALLSTAAELFRARGYDAVRVHEIAVAAGVSDKTFFNYFPAKEDVLTAIAGERVESYAALLPGADADVDLHRALKKFVRALAEDVEADRVFMRVVWTRSRFFVAEGDIKAKWLAAYARLAALFDGARRRGVLARGGPDSMQLAELFFSAVHLTVVNALIDWWPAPEPLARRLERAVTHFWAACSARTANAETSRKR